MTDESRLWAFTAEYTDRFVNCSVWYWIWVAWRTYREQVGGCDRVVYRWMCVRAWKFLLKALLKSTVIAYQTTLTFWTAAFPGLARNTPQLRVKAEGYNEGRITREEYDFADMMQRSRLSNMAFYVQSCGEIVILALIVGVLYGVNVRASQENNNWGLSVLIAFATGIWIVLAIPWFAVEKRRPGQPLPPNMNM